MPVTQVRGNTQIKAVTITNAEIATAAAIATSKLADGANFIQRDGSVAYTSDQPMGGNKITGLGTPSADGDAATKAYVDGVAQGLDVKLSVRVASTPAGGNLTLSGEQTIDGVTTTTDRILVKNQTAPAENGIYVTAAGAWSRSTDADTDAEVTSGLFTFIEEGTINADSGWVLSTPDPIVVDTTGLTFVQFSGAGSITAGAGLDQTGSTIFVGDVNRGVQVNTDDLEIDGSEIAGNGIVENGSNSWQIDVKPDVTGGANLAKVISAVANGVAVKIDDSTIGENGSNQLIIKSAGVTETQLNTSVAGDGIGGGAGTPLFVDQITREVPTGLINGSNTSYALANTPVVGTEQVFLNGILQNEGAGNDYTISGLTITYLTAPPTGDILLVTYLK